MYDYSRFSDADLKECGANLAALGGGASSMEDVANKIRKLPLREHHRFFRRQRQRPRPFLQDPPVRPA